MFSKIEIVTKSLSLFLFSIILSSCASSVVYTPALNAPATKLKKGDGQLLAGAAMLLESRPNNAEQTVTPGLFGGARYAFSDKLWLQQKLWRDVNSDRIGASLAGSLVLYNSLEPELWSLHVEVGLATNKNAIDGWGNAVRLMFQDHNSECYSIYAALGFAFGFHDIAAVDNGDWGSGVLVNIGTNWILSSNWTVNAELPIVLQYNHADKVTHFLLSPTLGVMWES